MSKQQINLFLPELQPRKESLSFRQALLLAGVVAAMLGLLSVFDGMRNANLAAQLAAAQQQSTQVDQDIKALQQRLPASQAVQLQQKLDGARQKLQQRERLFELIQQQNLGNREGFSAPMLAMARQHQQDLSVTGFALVAGGRQLHLAGQAKTAAALPQYIQRLQSEPSLQNVRFGRLVVERERARQLAFHTGPEPDKETKRR